MILGKVVGTVVTTISHPHYKNRRLLVVQPLGLAGEKPDDEFIALDNSHAGIGDTVLVATGGGARSAVGQAESPIDATIVAIIDIHEVRRSGGGA